MAAKKKGSVSSGTVTSNGLVSLDRIKDAKEFEDLVAAYFRGLDASYNIRNVRVQPSGTGGDGGRDILVTFRISDLLVEVERKWVVQCKFYKKAVGISHLATVNIPTLIHQYRAVGYLLVVKKDVAISTTNMFEELNKNCKFGYEYQIWTGSDFEVRLLSAGTALLKKFFP